LSLLDSRSQLPAKLVILLPAGKPIFFRPAISSARLNSACHAHLVQATDHSCSFGGALAMYALDYPLPNLLNHLASPKCAKVGNQWDRCGAYYVYPIG
jgi:hypothetical protein